MIPPRVWPARPRAYTTGRLEARAVARPPRRAGPVAGRPGGGEARAVGEAPRWRGPAGRCAGTPGGRQVPWRHGMRSERAGTSELHQPAHRAGPERILEAGRRAPSARNWQPWDFEVVTGRSELTDLAWVWQGARHVAQSAATIALVAPVLDDEHRREGLRYDLGQATMDIMLAATDLGIGSAHASVADQDLARQLLGFLRTASWPTRSRWLPGGPSHRRSSGPTAAPSRTSCTGRPGNWSRWYARGERRDVGEFPGGSSARFSTPARNR